MKFAVCQLNTPPQYRCEDVKKGKKFKYRKTAKRKAETYRSRERVKHIQWIRIQMGAYRDGCRALRREECVGEATRRKICKYFKSVHQQNVKYEELQSSQPTNLSQTRLFMREIFSGKYFLWMLFSSSSHHLTKGKHKQRGLKKHFSPSFWEKKKRILMDEV